MFLLWVQAQASFFWIVKISNLKLHFNRKLPSEFYFVFEKKILSAAPTNMFGWCAIV